MQRLPFIEHPDANTVIAHLNRGLKTRSPMILEGSDATGKTRLVEHWITSRVEHMQNDQIIYTRAIPKIKNKAQDKDGAAPPLTILILSQIDYVSHRLMLPHNHGQKNLLTQPDDSLFGTKKRAASSLISRIRSRVEELQIQAIVIDNAHLLDATTIEWLHNLREMFPWPVSLIFVAQLKPKEKHASYFEMALRQTPGLLNAITERETLSCITESYLLKQIMIQLCRALDIKLPFIPEDQSEIDEEAIANIQLTAKFLGHLWSSSQGNWTLLSRTGIFLNEYYTENPTLTRDITFEAIAYVEQRLRNLPSSAKQAKEKQADT